MKAMIAERCHKVALFACLVTMVFCWTQAVLRSHYPPVRSVVTAVAQAMQSVGTISDVAHKLWAADELSPVVPGQISQNRVEPGLPGAETIAARAGGFFAYRHGPCLDAWQVLSIAIETGTLDCVDQRFLEPL